MRDTAAEADLVRRARGGSREAFDRLIPLHFERVYGLLQRLVGNHEDAEDLAQECFVRAWRSLRWFRGDAALSTWLYRIAVHLARDHHRSRARKPPAEPLPVGPPALAPAPSGPASESERRELERGLDAALRRLPARLRAAFVLRVLEGLEYDDVAAVCGVTPSTARAHVMQARRLLVRWLAPWLERSKP